MIDTNPADPRLIRYSIKVFRLMLGMFPFPLRRDYGAHMLQVFRDCCLAAHRRAGALGLFSVWAFTLADWFKAVIEEQSNRLTAMSREKFIQLSSWGLLMAGLAHGLAFLVSNSQGFLLRNLGLQYSTTETARGILLHGFSFLFAAGLIGLSLHKGPDEHWGEKVTLGGAILFAILNFLAGFSLGISNSENAWTIWFSTFLLMFPGVGFHAILSKGANRKRGWLIPALLTGFSWPAATLVIFASEQYYGAWQAPLADYAGLAAALVTSVGLSLLGFNLIPRPILRRKPIRQE